MSVTIWLCLFLIYSTQVISIIKTNRIFVNIMIAIIKFNALRKRFQMSKENLNIDRINELARKRKNMA